MLPYIAEFLGTMILIILGDGVVANVNLNKSGMKRFLKELHRRKKNGQKNCLKSWQSIRPLPRLKKMP